MDVLHKVVQILVILAYIKSINSQCLGEDDCVCHCWSCLSFVPCLSCGKGWSGTVDNYCQRKNIAYRTRATSTSIYTDPTSGTRYPASNAVDEDEKTSAVTTSEQSPQLTLTLSSITDISRLYLKLYVEYGVFFDIYVTYSNLTSLPGDHLCASIYGDTTSSNRKINLRCDATIQGNQIVITRRTPGRLEIHEVQIHECSMGTYGSDCENQCRSCQNNRCNGDTGVCELGCKSGWYGDKCEKDCPESCGGIKTCNRTSGECMECSPGKFGPNCTEACSSNCVDSVCQRNGDCVEGCTDGWIGSKCYIQCVLPNCEKCSESSINVVCEICQDGYFLDDRKMCQKCPSNCILCENGSNCIQCKPRWKGKQCDEACDENCIDGLCTMYGTCTFGCNNSKHGIGCTAACRDNCVHCFDRNNCTECLPGFYGRYCTWLCKNNCFNCTSFDTCESCKSGFYGNSCSESCPRGCQTCEPQNKCSSCKEGWSGDLCQCSENCSLEECGEGGKCLRGCKDSFYGDYCNISCPIEDCQKCNQSSGICTLCFKGNYGNNCAQKCSTRCLETKCDIEGSCLKGYFGYIYCGRRCFHFLVLSRLVYVFILYVVVLLGSK